MERGPSREFRFLDTEADRQALIADIRRVRRAVVQLAESVPQERHYEARYHGWTLAALLAHLQLMDSLALSQIKLALTGVCPPFASGALHGFNALTARLFRQRVVATTLRGIKNYEDKLVDFIVHLPVDRFSKPVYYPPHNTYLTVERALQAYFLFHWQEHLLTLQRVEGIYDEPPSASAEM